MLEIAKRVGISRPMVWRWQQRFAEEGIEGLLRDKTRPPGIPPVPQAKVHAVVERTLREPPGAVTHWTGRAMAKATGGILCAGPGFHQVLTSLSPNMMANWVFASADSRGGIFHC